MSDITTRHILKPETLAALDAEVFAGNLDALGHPPPPPLDPDGDPFGRGYAWLEEPGADSPFEVAYSSLRSKELADWYAVAGRDLRKIALGGSLAGGTDDQVFRGWVQGRFVALCEAAGTEGTETLAALRSAPAPDAEPVRSTAELLQARPEFGSLDPEQIVAAALIAFHWLKAGPPG